MLSIIFDATNRCHVLAHAGVEDVATAILADVDAWNARFRPAAFAFAFDGPGARSWRQALYPAYKANRKHDESIKARVASAREQLIACGMPVFELPEYEADDIVGGLVKRWCTNPVEKAVIVSTDSDMVQFLRHDQVSLCTKFSRGVGGLLPTFLTAKQWEKENVPISRWMDFRLLTGKTQDGIPGMQGVGPTRAKPVILEVPNLKKCLAPPQSLSKGLAATWSSWLETIEAQEAVVRPREVPQEELDKQCGESHMYDPWR